MKIEHTEVRKITIHTTCKEMWNNASNHLNIAVAAGTISNRQYLEIIADLVKNLLGDTTQSGLHRLFRDGYTTYLLGDHLKEFDQENVLREVIISPDFDNGKTYRIDHKYIWF